MQRENIPVSNDNGRKKRIIYRVIYKITNYTLMQSSFSQRSIFLKRTALKQITKYLFSYCEMISPEVNI